MFMAKLKVANFDEIYIVMIRLPKGFKHQQCIRIMDKL